MPGDMKAIVEKAIAWCLTLFARREQLVASDPVTNRALVSVISIMGFLAALAAGLAQTTSAGTARWQMVISSEATVEIRPRNGHPIETDLDQVAEYLRATPGITFVRIYPREEVLKLLEPWFGSGPLLAELPVPRLIAIGLDDRKPPDLPALIEGLDRLVKGTTLDDHRDWTQRLRTIGDSLVFASLSIMVLVLAATGLAIVFATRGAISANRDIIEVLHFIGADDSYIAYQFQRHFLRLGLMGGVIGGGIALILIGALFLLARAGTHAVTDRILLNFLFEPSNGLAVFGAIVSIVVAVGVLAAFVSHVTVHRTIGQIS